MKALNIGGGPQFCAEGWINLDATTGFLLSPDCRFPVESSSVQLVYSSHTLEHLDDATVARVLDESWRVLKRTGRLMIKLPDFELILAAYRRNDIEYFDDPIWGWPPVLTTLANRGMPDTLATRAAFLFCGWWNREFGDLYVGCDPHRAGAYCGPPVMSQERLKAILTLDHSPHTIAAILSSYVTRNESDYTFNHQNAWSRAEFITLLIDHGFSECAASHCDIPGIDEMRHISIYYHAAPDAVVPRLRPREAD